MTKRAQIEALYVQGKRRAEIIALLPDFSPGYIGNVIGDIRNPGAHKRRYQKWASSEKGRRTLKKHVQKRDPLYNREWRRQHPDQVAAWKKGNIVKNQETTRSLARNHGQPWTIHEIEFLRENGCTMSVKQMALALGRSYWATLTRVHLEGIDVRGNKEGGGSRRFVGTAGGQSESHPAIA